MDIPYKPTKPGKDQAVIPKQPWGPPQMPQVAPPQMGMMPPQPSLLGRASGDWDELEPDYFTLALSQYLGGPDGTAD